MNFLALLRHLEGLFIWFVTRYESYGMETGRVRLITHIVREKPWVVRFAIWLGGVVWSFFHFWVHEPNR